MKKIARKMADFPTGLSRRKFLAHSLAAGGAVAIPNVIPASALGRNGAVAPGERIVMGAIGVGGRGSGDLGWMLGEPARDDLDWDIWLGPCPWRPFNRGYLAAGWYHFHDFATDTAMWGAHTIAQSLAGVDMSERSIVELEYGPATPNLVVQLGDGLRMIMIRDTALGQPSPYWHGSCGERFDGERGWVAAADGYSKPDVSSRRCRQRRHHRAPDAPWSADEGAVQEYRSEGN